MWACVDTVTYPLALAFPFLGAGVLGAESEPSLIHPEISKMRYSLVNENIPIDVFDGDLDAGDVLLEGSNGAGDSVGGELGGEDLPVDVGGGLGVFQDSEQDLAISLSCNRVSDAEVRRGDYCGLPSQVIPGILFDRAWLVSWLSRWRLLMSSSVGRRHRENIVCRLIVKG